MKTITICSSAAFYRQAFHIQEQLESPTLKVVLPKTATLMKERDDYEVSHYKTWFGNAEDYHKKTDLMRAHFSKVSAGDAILVLNYEKHGVMGYIGGNVLMEMAIAFHLGKPIYVLNEVPAESPFLEEILGMQSTILFGDLSLIK